MTECESFAIASILIISMAKEVVKERVE